MLFETVEVSLGALESQGSLSPCFVGECVDDMDLENSINFLFKIE